ncbi:MULTISPECIES: sugar phosphate isomerase/epimerase family protein [unclassified Streptomyces]|uniref:sugar phosphate isomerase/epimerase family protein n=1 Tax=unclassified Streptomyces TaxID=2593676 RepID=UPI0036E51C17
MNGTGAERTGADATGADGTVGAGHAGRHPVAVNPLHFYATAEGWFDFTAAPSVEEILEAVAEAGFGAVQTSPPADEPPARYRARLAAAGLRPGPGYAALVWDEDPAVRRRDVERVRREAGRLAACGCALAFTALDVDLSAPRMARPARGHDARPDRLAHVAAHLAEAAGALRAEGVVPALHPHVGSWVETARETAAVLDAAGPDLAFGPDTGHLAWAGAPLSDILGRYRDRVAGLHVKDMSLAAARTGGQAGLDYRSTVAGGLWREPGDGDLDLIALVAGLGADDDCWIVVEVDHSRLDPRAGLARSAAWVRRLDTALRNAATG